MPRLDPSVSACTPDCTVASSFANLPDAWTSHALPPSFAKLLTQLCWHTLGRDATPDLIGRDAILNPVLAFWLGSVTLVFLQCCVSFLGVVVGEVLH